MLHKIPQPRPARGKEITPFLHVLGLKDIQVQELKAIVQHGDENALTKFSAYYHPGFIELDYYIAVLRKRFLENLGKPVHNASEIEKIAATNRTLFNDQPSPFDLTVLDTAQLKNIYEFEGEKGLFVNREFVRSFGDDKFLENYTNYKQLYRSYAYTFYAPKSDPRRPLLDMLADQQILLKGRKIDLHYRLSILQLDQLNQIAHELNLSDTFQNRKDAIQALAKIPGSAILLAMIYSIDDLFHIDPAAVNIKAIDSELNLWSSYSKLICWTVNQAAPNLIASHGL